MPRVIEHRKSKIQKQRSGITLMEVLIAMFVASVGLLGLAALIPVGGHNIREASKNTRANAVARAAYREIKARGWLRPAGNQMMYLMSDIDFIPGPPDLPGPLGVARMNGPICIDPLLLGRQNPPVGDPMWQFPYRLASGNDEDLGEVTPSYQPPQMRRASVKAWPGAPGFVGADAAVRLMQNEDDRIFELPTDNGKRARAVMGDENRLQSSGEYSWLATVMPAYAATGSQPPRSYLVSVAVFYKRPLLAPDVNIANRTDGPPPERIVYADFLSGGIGWGGGDVRLRLPISNAHNSMNPSQDIERSDLPKLRPGNWIMLMGQTNDATPQTMMQWYRIAATSGSPYYADGSTTPASPSGQREWIQDITLDGADLNPGDYQDAFAGGDLTLFAAIFEGVVGVYTKTIEVDSWAMP